MTAAAQIEEVEVKKGIEQRQQKVKKVRQKLNSHSPKFIYEKWLKPSASADRNF